MHASSMENMQKCYERYICGAYFSDHERALVLDIGGANINGSYSDIFSSTKFQYIAADIAQNEGVDLVLTTPYELPYADASVDVVISGQAFEHVEFFWKLFEEMARVVKDDGWIFLIAPSGGPIHRFPVDCYRFYPDSFHALAKLTSLHAVEVRQDCRGPWQDLVGVFSKAAILPDTAHLTWKRPTPHEINRFMAPILPRPTDIMRKSDKVERISGKGSYLDVLRDLHQAIRPRNYLEIGVRAGKSLRLSDCATIAIDPEPDIDPADFPKVDLFKMPSDHFFDRPGLINLEARPLDLVFIDGMHLFEFVLRDFINIEFFSHADTVVVIDDIFPNHIQQASRERTTQVWTGDVWKILLCLKEYRPDLDLTTIDSSPTGLLAVRNLKRGNKRLIEHYNPIIRQYKELTIDGCEEDIMNRHGALAPGSAEYADLLHAVKEQGSRRLPT